MSRLVIAALIASSVAFSGPVFAQGPDQAQTLVLKVDSGSILTSTGGEYVSAETGQTVVPGQKLMVNADSSARVVYDQGNTDPKDDCVIEFNKAGVFDVPSECKRAVAWVPGSNGKTALYVIGGAAVAAALIGSGGSDRETPPPPPVSLGNN